MHLLPPALSLHQRALGVYLVRAGRAASLSGFDRRLREGRRAARRLNEPVHLALAPYARTRMLVIRRVKC